MCSTRTKFPCHVVSIHRSAVLPTHFDIVFDGHKVAEIVDRAAGRDECWLTVDDRVVSALPMGFRCWSDTFPSLDEACDFLGVNVPV